MTPSRLNALTDGVVAIVMTIMVLELKFPAELTAGEAAEAHSLFAAYLLAFVNVAIFWNNHHHLMHAAHRVTGSVLWANHSLLFCLTLFPLMIRWIGDAGVTPWPVASFGLVLIGAALSYRMLQHTLAAAEGEGSKIRQEMRHPWKEYSSLILYIIAVPTAVFLPYLSIAIYVIVSIIWFVPDRRFERLD